MCGRNIYLHSLSPDKHWLIHFPILWKGGNLFLHFCIFIFVSLFSERNSLVLVLWITILDKYVFCLKNVMLDGAFNKTFSSGVTQRKKSMQITFFFWKTQYEDCCLIALDIKRELRYIFSNIKTTFYLCFD